MQKKLSKHFLLAFFFSKADLITAAILDWALPTINQKKSERSSCMLKHKIFLDEKKQKLGIDISL